MTLRTGATFVTFVLAAAGSVRSADAQAVGQADVQIQRLSVAWQLQRQVLTGARSAVATPTRNLVINVTVFSNNDDDAQGVGLMVFLPPESKAMSVPANCVPQGTNGSTGTANAYVMCKLGALPVNASSAITIAASAPPSYVVPRVGVFAWSQTSDPNTANNHAESVAP
jgi:Domain of unknown function DUF11